MSESYIDLLLVTPIVLFILVFAGLAAKALLDTDEKFLKTYQPTPEIADLAEQNTLTDKGKAILYRADPQLVDAQSFVKYCQVKKGGVEPLACVAPNPGRGIFAGRQMFLLDIDDAKFADHKYAASVHEMLHEAYKRIRSSSKDQLNALLDAELARHKDDPHLAAVIDILKQKTDKREDDVHSELHSKFGVEYSDLTPELEAHYGKYFANRPAVVSLYKSGGFNSRVRRIDALNAELTALNSTLTAYQNAGNIDGFNSLVGQFNAKAAESRTLYNEIQEFYTLFNPEYQPPQGVK